MTRPVIVAQLYRITAWADRALPGAAIPRGEFLARPQCKLTDQVGLIAALGVLQPCQPFQVFVEGGAFWLSVRARCCSPHRWASHCRCCTSRSSGAGSRLGHGRFAEADAFLVRANRLEAKFTGRPSVVVIQ